MELGSFSVSLTVEDLEASRAFYAKLGFVEVHGEESQGWLILRNGQCTIGLFQGMFDKNILTFNPGWNQEGETLGEFADIRELQKHLKAEGLTLIKEPDESGSGPDSLTLVDPDDNPILIDQHV